MIVPNNDVSEVPKGVAEENALKNFYSDTLTGNKKSSSPRKLSILKVLRQLIESFTDVSGPPSK